MRPNCHKTHLPKLTHPVPENQRMGFYQLMQSMGGSPEGQCATQKIFAQTTSYNAPAYMASPQAASPVIPLSRTQFSLHPSYPWHK